MKDEDNDDVEGVALAHAWASALEKGSMLHRLVVFDRTQPHAGRAGRFDLRVTLSAQQANLTDT